MAISLLWYNNEKIQSVLVVEIFREFLTFTEIKKMHQKQLKQNNHNNKNNIIVEIPEQKFANILINYFGHKQTVSWSNEVAFCIGINEIKQIYYSMLEKFERERFTHLDIFLITIIFNDNSVIKMTTIESLNNYHEIRNVSPISVSFSWNILVDFGNSDTIENQKIELTFAKNNKNPKGSIKLNVEYTNQSWGYEVYYLIKSLIGDISRGERKELIVYNFLKKYKLFYIIFTIIFICSLIVTAYEHHGLHQERYKEFLESKSKHIESTEISIKKIKATIPKNEAIFILKELYDLQDRGLVSKSEFNKALNYLILNYNYLISDEELFNTDLNSFFNNKHISKLIETIEKNKILLSKEEEKLRKIEGQFFFTTTYFNSLLFMELITIFKLSIIKIILYLYSNYFIFYYSDRTFILLTNKEKKKNKNTIFIKVNLLYFCLELLLFLFLVELWLQ